MGATKLLKELAKERAAGPPPSFNELHLLKAVFLIGDRGPIGRLALSKELGLGQGATRTLIDHLESANLIKVDKSGCRLTELGGGVFGQLKKRVAKQCWLSKSSIAVGSHNFGVLVKGAAGKVKSGIEQRDAAIKAGAIGAVTIVLSGGKLIMPPSGDEVRGEDIKRSLMETFGPEDGDVIIISSAETEGAAEYGGLAAAWTLLEDDC